MFRRLNKVFYHQTVNTTEIENYISRQLGYDYNLVFNQYLRTTDIPTLEFYFSKSHDSVFYRYPQCVDGFGLPLVLKDKLARLRIVPGREWKCSKILKADATLVAPTADFSLIVSSTEAQQPPT